MARQAGAGLCWPGGRANAGAEYALILALIAVIAVLALIFLGGTITSLFSSVGNSV